MTKTETVSAERLREIMSQPISAELRNLADNFTMNRAMTEETINVVDAFCRFALLAAEMGLSSRTQELAEGEEKIEAFVAYGPMRSYDHENLLDRVLGPALESLEEVRDTRGNLTGWNIVITSPAPERSKEEVGVKALEIAKRWAIWIDDASAGEEDEGGYLRATFEADKAALLAALSKPGEQG